MIPSSKQWIFDHPSSFPEDDGLSIAHLIRSFQECYAVADGSFKNNISTAYFTLAAPSLPAKNQIVGSIVTPGLGGFQSPYCSELSGLLALLVTLEV